jgi:hypothetical protein
MIGNDSFIQRVQRTRQRRAPLMQNVFGAFQGPLPIDTERHLLADPLILSKGPRPNSLRRADLCRLMVSHIEAT